MSVVVGVDIGGSHISCAALNNGFTPISGSLSTGKVNSKATKNDIFLQWSKVINKTLEQFENEEIDGIGVGIPGPFDYEKGIAFFQSNDKYEALYNVSIKKELPNYLKRSNLPIRFLNDASSFGIGGSIINKYEAGTKVLAITLGTGFGAAFLKDLVPLHKGAIVPENGCLWDKNFKDELADDYFSTRWFINKYMKLSGRPRLKGVKELVMLNDPFSKEVFREFSQNLGEFLSPHLKKFQPDHLLIGGNIARAHSLFLPMAVEIWKKDQLIVPVTVMPNTEEAVMVGSSYFFRQNFLEKIGNRLHNK